ncbi:hypothetical protein VTK73DRAFT_6195 [Phialemonium thermophilum]|uniref:Glucanase n=1 Tax=Phialemonium thermophilum TaxID=223376 RepID=A0ABR3WK97_9PEZI
MFRLLNREFTFDVDVSELPCGLNGAVYFSQMDEDGGAARFPTNKAGARYGTGYCDSQCPTDIKFINGEVRPVCFLSDFCLYLHRLTRRRPTSTAGTRPTPTRAPASTAPAAPRWTSGRPTWTRPPTRRTRARCRSRRGARAPTAATATIGTRGCATRVSWPHGKGDLLLSFCSCVTTPR